MLHSPEHAVSRDKWPPDANTKSWLEDACSGHLWLVSAFSLAHPSGTRMVDSYDNRY